MSTRSGEKEKGESREEDIRAERDATAADPQKPPPPARGDGHTEHELEPERFPGAVKQSRALESDVAPSGHVLSVSGLHPEDAFGDAGLDGSGEASATSGDP
jgi:hypothetical protein